MKTNAEIDILLSARLHLIEQAARSLCAHRWDELKNEIIYLWWRRYLLKPEKYWGMLNNPHENEVVADMKQIGKRVIEWWERAERDVSLQTLSDFQTLNPIEWGECNVKQRYLDGIGDYANGEYVATDDDLMRLFDLVARRCMVGEDGHGLGRVDAADLMSAYQAATPKTREAIRKLASGYSVSSLPNRNRTFMAVARVLQSAL